MKKLVLIDGNAIIHRAYHSMPKTLSTRKGEKTNAVYGFVITLIKVLEDLRPEYIAATFDLAGPTFRHEVFTEYKATRVKADQDLYDQIPRVKQLVETFGIPIYEKEGFEADDCLGTIVEIIQKSKIKDQNDNSKIKNNVIPSEERVEESQNRVSGNNIEDLPVFPPVTSSSPQNNNLSAKKPQGGPSIPGLTPDAYNLEIFIVSGDKDIFQLINGNVKVYNLRKGLSDTQIVDSDTIKEQYGLDPHDFVDLKALAGDASDNIPGVPGIGPKTATELIQCFDTLEKIYQNLDSPDIKPRTKELLEANREQALLSQHLATIHRDVPLDFDLDKCRFGQYDKDKLRELFDELGFQSLLRRFGRTSEAKGAAPTLGGVGIPTDNVGKVQQKDEQLRLL